MGTPASCNAEPVHLRQPENVALRCIIVDDNVEFVASASRLLERQGLDIVGTASCGAEAVELISRTRPQVVLLDVELGDESGFDVAERVATVDDGPRIVLISTHSGEELAELVPCSTALGFLPKSQLTARAVVTLLRGT